MGLVMCPECRAKVFLMADGSCPNCLKRVQGTEITVSKDEKKPRSPEADRLMRFGRYGVVIGTLGMTVSALRVAVHAVFGIENLKHILLPSVVFAVILACGLVQLGRVTRDSPD